MPYSERSDYECFTALPAHTGVGSPLAPFTRATAPFTGSYFSQQKGCEVQKKKAKQLYRIPLEFANGMTRTVKVKASSRDLAESRALKFHPNAVGVKRGV